MRSAVDHARAWFQGEDRLETAGDRLRVFSSSVLAITHLVRTLKGVDTGIILVCADRDRAASHRAWPRCAWSAPSSR